MRYVLNCIHLHSYVYLYLYLPLYTCTFADKMDNFKVSDETGQIDMKRWINTDSPARDDFQQNDYVRVIGAVKQQGQKLHIMSLG